GGAYTLGGLRCFSLFGDVKADGSPFTQADCPGGTAVIRSSPWDSLRTSVDTTGYIKRILALMPHPNFFGAGGMQGGGCWDGVDGQNTATYRWLSGREGSSQLNSAIGVVNGTDDYTNRNQINLRIDHNFNTKHRLNVNWTYERDSGAAQF